MFGHSMIDFAGLWIPERDGQAIGPARTESSVPGAPLLAGKSVAVGASKQIFDRDFAAHRERDIAFCIPRAGPLVSIFVYESVGILIDIDELQGAKIHRVRTRGPCAIEEIRIKN